MDTTTAPGAAREVEMANETTRVLARGDHLVSDCRHTERDGEDRCYVCDYLHLCKHENKVGECDTCAANADRDRKAADYDRLASENERLTRDADFWREIVAAFWRFAGVEGAPEGEPWKVNETNGRLYALRSERDAATARAEALEAALRGVTNLDALGRCRSCACTPEVSTGVCGCAVSPDQHRAASARAALAATPPADLTHPAYRAGYRAGQEAMRERIEAAVRELARMVPTGYEMETTSDDDDPDGWWGADDVLVAIRTLVTTEVRDA